MVRVEHVSGGVIRHQSIGRSTPGDTHDVSEEAAAYLCEEREEFEYSDVIDAEYEDVTDSEGDGGDTDDESDGGAFDEDAWLDQDYTDRAEQVRTGEVDAHLETIDDIETSGNVRDAIGERRAELEE